MTSKEIALREMLYSRLPQRLSPVEAGKELDIIVYEQLWGIIERLTASWEAVRISDLHPTPRRAPLVTYLNALKRTFWMTLVAMIFATILGIISATSLVQFVESGTSLLHPYLALFLSLGAFLLLVHALMSALTIKKLIETQVWMILQNSSRD